MGQVRDAFVAKIDVSGKLVHATCLGGSGTDIAKAIAVDAQGNAYVACLRNLSLKQLMRSGALVMLREGLPFPVSIPNQKTVAAMRDANNNAAMKRDGTFRERRERI